MLSANQWDGGTVQQSVESSVKRKKGCSRASERSFMEMRNKNGPSTALGALLAPLGNGRKMMIESKVLIE